MNNKQSHTGEGKGKHSFLKKAGLSVLGIGNEIKDIGIRNSDALDFAVLGIISDRVFDTLGLPERDISQLEESYIYKKDAYFSYLEDLNDIDMKKAISDLLIHTHDFRGRKYIFEEILGNQIPEYSVFKKLIYTTGYDAILRKVFQEDETSVMTFLDKVSHLSYNNSEAELCFDILYQKSGGTQQENVQKMLEDTSYIIRKSRKGKKPLSASESQHISKTISLLKINGKEIIFENIEEHLGLYTFIPTILSSTHGENSTSIGVVKGFVKTHRPKTIKSFGKHFKVVEAFISDGMNFEPIKKKVIKGKIWMNTFLKRTKVDQIQSWLKEQQVAFGEKKMDVFLAYTRYFNQDSLGDFDTETHKELMKNYFLIDKILQDIESGIQAKDGSIEKKPNSRIYRFLLGRGKSESIGPFAAQAWLMSTRFFPLAKFLSFIPFIKVHALLLVAKTTFVFAFYKLVDLGLYFLKMIPSFERFQRFGEIQSAHSISASPELQDLLIDNIGELHTINRDVEKIRKIKKLQSAQSKLDEDVYNLGEDTISEETQLQRSLLGSEIESLLEGVDQNELEEEIVQFKMVYLHLLEATGKLSSMKISEKENV